MKMQVLLEGQQKLPLGLVGLIEINGPDGHTPVNNGRGRGRDKSLVFIGAVEHVVPPQGKHDLLQQGVLIVLRLLRLGAVV